MSRATNPTSLFYMALRDGGPPAVLGWASPIRTRVKGPVGRWANWWRSIQQFMAAARDGAGGRGGGDGVDRREGGVEGRRGGGQEREEDEQVAGHGSGTRAAARAGRSCVASDGISY